MTTFYLLVLRFLHVSGGILWVGAAAVYLFFLEPSVKSLGPASGKFMQTFMVRQKYPMYMGLTSLVTVLSGTLLYLFVSGGLQSGWILAGPGIVYTVGSLAAFAAFFMGMFMIKPRAEKLSALGQEIGKAGGPPTPEQAAAMRRLDTELGTIEKVEFGILALAMVSMALARYVHF